MVVNDENTPAKMNADVPYPSISKEKKLEKLMALIEKRKNKERAVVKKRDSTSVKWKKFNSHYYKKLFRLGARKVKVSGHGNDVIQKESCSGSRRKKRRLCCIQGSGEGFSKSPAENKIESGSCGLPTKTHDDDVLPYVDKLGAYHNRGQNAVIFDGQERVVKVVRFVLSLVDEITKPILIIASTRALSSWEVEFSKWSKSVNVVMYKGNKDIRGGIRDGEMYSENGCVKFQVLLSSPEAIEEDMELLNHINWTLLVIDECQRPIISTHLKSMQMLVADMKLLTVSGEPLDICQSYKNILTLIDCEYETMKRVADMEKINSLKERLSPFIAFECKFDTPDFEEHWVPVHLSSMQIEQYCSILASNSEILSSSSTKASLPDILTKLQKCCDHPYLVDPTLRHSSKAASEIDPFDAEINVSGKMQLLNKLLLEIKLCGLRAVVLFQSAVNSEKISTGHFLDDLVHRRFGANSYVYIPGKTLSKKEKKESLKLFNDTNSKQFICLFDYGACHPTVTLSRVDVAILFNSEGNPLNDIKALKKVTIDSPQLKLFRLYSTFTVEEKALIISKQGTSLDGYISSRVWHKLLAWGACNLFSKLQTSTDSVPIPIHVSFIDDVVDEVSSLLNNTCVKTGPTNRSLVSKAELQNGGYKESVLLFGETETETENDTIDSTPSKFWCNLVKQSQRGREDSCGRFSKRVKTPRNFFEFESLNDETIVRTKPRSRRKVRRKRTVTNRESLNLTDAELPILPSTRTNEGQQSLKDGQPPQHDSSSTPLEAEIERIRKEREQITKSHQEKKSFLLSECEKEILEVKKKYGALINDSETHYTNEDKILEEYEKLVYANKLLADMLSQDWQDTLELNSPEPNPKRKRKVTETGTVQIPTIPASALVRPSNPCSMSGLITYLSGHSLAGPGLRAPAPHLRSSPSLFANRPTTSLPFLDQLPSLSTTQTPPCAILTDLYNQLYLS